MSEQDRAPADAVGDPSGLGPEVRQSLLGRYDLAQKAGGLLAPVLAAVLAFFIGGLIVLFQALPYVLTLIAVAGVIGTSTPPAAVGRPWGKA